MIELSKILEQKQCRGVTSILTDSMEDVYNIILNYYTIILSIYGMKFLII